MGEIQNTLLASLLRINPQQNALNAQTAEENGNVIQKGVADQQAWEMAQEQQRKAEAEKGAYYGAVTGRGNTGQAANPKYAEQANMGSLQAGAESTLAERGAGYKMQELEAGPKIRADASIKVQELKNENRTIQDIDKQEPEALKSGMAIEAATVAHEEQLAAAAASHANAIRQSASEHQGYVSDEDKQFMEAAGAEAERHKSEALKARARHALLQEQLITRGYKSPVGRQKLAKDLGAAGSSEAAPASSGAPAAPTSSGDDYHY